MDIHKHSPFIFISFKAKQQTNYIHREGFLLICICSVKLNFQQSIIIESLTRGKRYNSRKNKPVQCIEGREKKKKRHFDVLMAKHASFTTQFIATRPSESWRVAVSHISSIRKPTPSSKIIISTAERGCVRRF